MAEDREASPNLSCKLSEYNQKKAADLDSHILQFFSLEQEEINDRIKPPNISILSSYSICLPSFIFPSAEMEKFMRRILVDKSMQIRLEKEKVLNWCPRLCKLYPLHVEGDGNCLLHSASVAMWGLQDVNLSLRRLLYVAMATDEGDLWNRWQRYQSKQNANIPDGGVRMSLTQWQSDWENLVNMASEETSPSPDDLPYRSLEEIHVFVLSQILRRPIILLSEMVMRNMNGSVIAPNTAPGIYLPLLWESKKCCRSPLILAYSNNHFCPLVHGSDKASTESMTLNRISDGLYDIEYSNDAYDLIMAIPLLGANSLEMSVKFLTAEEEKNTRDVISDYLDLCMISLSDDGLITIPAAKIKHRPLKDEYNLMIDVKETIEKYWHDSKLCQAHKNQGIHDLNSTIPTEFIKEISGITKTENYVTKPCKEKGCTFFGTSEYGGRCSVCYKKLSKNQFLWTCEHESETETESGGNPCIINTCDKIVPISSAYQPYCYKHKHLKINSAFCPPPVDYKTKDKSENWKVTNTTKCTSCKNLIPVDSPDRLCDTCLGSHCYAVKRKPSGPCESVNKGTRTLVNENVFKNFSPCLFPECIRLGQSDLMGYCRTCFEKKINPESVMQNTNTSSNNQNLEVIINANTCYSNNEEMLVENPALNGLQTCCAPDCGRRAYHMTNGLCDDCVNLLAQVRKNQGSIQRNTEETSQTIDRQSSSNNNDDDIFISQHVKGPPSATYDSNL